MTNAELLAEQLDGARDWTRMLLADFRGDDWSFQPAPGLAHALFLCGHLASAQNTLIHVRCLGSEGMLDAGFASHFPIGQAVKSQSEHDYPAVDSVLATMDEIHGKTLAAVRAVTDDLLARPALGKGGQPHPHYRDIAGAVSHCARHEAFHAGQIATIRRLLGKPFLR